MYSFSNKSKAQLLTCDERLRLIAFEAIQITDFAALEGYRSPDRQLELYNDGKSKLTHGKHNFTPSMAIDIVPYPVPIKWGEDSPRELGRFYYLAGVWMAIAKKHNIKLRWGGDFNQNENFSDDNFFDLIHFEIVGV